MNYSDKLKNPKWQKKRLEIMQRDNFTCVKCNDTETTLNIHHSKYFKSKEPWEVDEKYLHTLCKHCHFEIEVITSQLKLEFENIIIYKKYSKKLNNRLMFVNYNNDLAITIYDFDDNFICGFKLDRLDIIKNIINGI